MVYVVLLIAGDKSTNPAGKNLLRTKYEKYLKKQLVTVSPNIRESGKNHEPDQPDMATLQDFFMTLDPELGYVPRERLLKNYKTIHELKGSQSGKSSSLLQWSAVPANIGGRTRAIMWDPNDPDHKKVWAGGVTGGLWYRNDITGNLSLWQPVNDFWSSLNISCMTFDPNNPMIFYVGTGEAQTAIITYRESSGTGDGIWKSTDGGITWSLLETTLGFEYVTDIRVRDEDGTSVIYAGVTSGVYKGTNHSSDPSDGLFRSADGGLTWEQVLPDIPGYGEPYSVADIDIGADGRLYVGTMQNVDTKGGATILYTDDGTPGTWTVYNYYVGIIQNHPTYNIPSRVILSCAPSNEDVVYAVIAAGYVDGFKRYKARYILKSSNKGETWIQKNIPDEDWATIAWHALLLKVNPNNSSKLFTGGKDMWASTNSGAGWDRISDWTKLYTGGGDDYVHCDQHALEFKPGSSGTFMISTDGGVFYTTTGTNSQPVFQEKNQGYNTLQFYTCDIHPLSGTSMFLGGLQDNGTMHYQYNPLSINSVIDNGDGAFCGYDENEPNIWITSVYYNQYTIFFNGTEFKYLDYDNGIFINPADYDSKNNILYSNAVDFFGGSPNTILRTKGIPYFPTEEYLDLQTGTNVYFSHIKVSKWSPPGATNLFLGTQTGRVYKVTNAHSNPVVHEITGSGFPLAYVSCVAVGETEQDLLVTFSNFGVVSVWLTTNGGMTWKNVEGNLPDMPVRWAIFHPGNYEQALLATELGVWSTIGINDEEVAWTQEPEGFANVRVDMLKLRNADYTLLAATHGRGFYTANYPVISTVSVNHDAGCEFSVFPNPSAGVINIIIPDRISLSASVRIFNISGMEVFNNTLKLSENQRVYQISLYDFPKGVYYINLISEDKKYHSKFIKE